MGLEKAGWTVSPGALVVGGVSRSQASSCSRYSAVQYNVWSMVFVFFFFSIVWIQESGGVGKGKDRITSYDQCLHAIHSGSSVSQV